MLSIESRDVVIAHREDVQAPGEQLDRGADLYRGGIHLERDDLQAPVHPKEINLLAIPAPLGLGAAPRRNLPFPAKLGK